MVSSIGQREQSTILLASMKGLSMKHVKTLYAAVLSLAAIGSAAAQTTVLNEGFENVAGLSGWTQVNNSVPAGTGWFQGVPEIFPAHAGPADSYAAASYLSAANGTGTVDNWLITPTLDLSGITDISFYTRHPDLAGYSDLLEVRFAYGSSSNPDDFDTLVTAIGNLNGYPTEWALFNTNYAFEDGPGRFAFRYVGPADLANYVGIDSVTVVTAVPEPSAWMMLAMGLGGFGLLRRKHQS
jgi:hypothetical protein